MQKLIMLAWAALFSFSLSAMADAFAQTVSDQIRAAVFYSEERPELIETIKNLLANNANVNALNERGLAPLHQCAKHGFCKIARLLLESRCMVDPISMDVFSCTPLVFAVLYEQHDMAKLLLEHRAHPNASSTMGTVLHAAIMKHNLGLVKLLALYGADEQIEASKNMSTIQLAAETAFQFPAPSADVTILIYILNRSDENPVTLKPLADSLQQQKPAIAQFLRTFYSVPECGNCLELCADSKFCKNCVSKLRVYKR